MVVANIMMIQHLFQLFDSDSIWWAPVILEIIIAHFCIFIQMVIDYCSWRQKKIIWQKELMFDNIYNQLPD